MDKAQVYDLLIEIKENYPNFDVSPENVDRHLKYLHDFSFEAAMQNVDEHVKLVSITPTLQRFEVVSESKSSGSR